MKQWAFVDKLFRPDLMLLYSVIPPLHIFLNLIEWQSMEVGIELIKLLNRASDSHQPELVTPRSDERR